MKKEEKLREIKRISEKNGFRAKLDEEKGVVHVYVIKKSRKKDYVLWFSYDGEIFSGDNTDVLNIWLCNTMPDLQCEQLVRFFRQIAETAGTKDTTLLRTFVDPEDWQEIADVSDAYKDPRYIKMLDMPKQGDFWGFDRQGIYMTMLTADRTREALEYRDNSKKQYLEALQKYNAELEKAGIKKAEPNGEEMKGTSPQTTE